MKPGAKWVRESVLWMAYHAFRVTKVTNDVGHSEFRVRREVPSSLSCCSMLCKPQKYLRAWTDFFLRLDGMLMRLACGSLNLVNLPFVLPPPVFAS